MNLSIRTLVDYFYQCSPTGLERMGVASEKLPALKQWVKSIQNQMALPDTEKEMFYLLWYIDEYAVGHSNLSHLIYGKTAKIHLHLWSNEKRQSGLGRVFMEQCLTHFFSRFELPEIICEPKADNPAPNRLITQLGFKYIKTYITTPGPINFQQRVNRFILDT